MQLASTTSDIAKQYERQNKRYHSRRLKAILLLGGKCSSPACLVQNGCKDTRCLQIDHITGGGTRALKDFGSFAVISAILKNPEEAIKQYQLLCANCNWIKKSINHEVPHTKRQGAPTQLLLKVRKKGIIPLDLKCPNCHAEGEANFRKAGFKQLYQRRIQRYQCKTCGRVFHK